MQKEMIIEKLREQGFRITKQRSTILDVILEEDCSCCKEIYYKVSKIDKAIGIATVYRMITTLENIGAISREPMYKVACGEECQTNHKCHIELDDGTTLHFTQEQWKQIVGSGLKACGYINNQKVEKILLESCGVKGLNG